MLVRLAELGLYAVLAGFLGVFLMTYVHSLRVAAFAVGATAGLQEAQLRGVHAMTIAVVIFTMMRMREGSPIGWSRVPLVILAAAPLAVTVFYGALVNSPALAGQLLLLAGSAALLSSTTSDLQRTVIKGLLAAVSVASALALAQTAGLFPTELFHRDISGIGRPSGWYSEPDWLGVHAALGVLLAKEHLSRSSVKTVLLTINGLACVLAFARAAWLAVACVLILQLALRALRRRGSASVRPKLQTNVVGFAAAVALAAVPIAVNDTLRQDLRVRSASFFAAEDERDVSANARIRQTTSLMILAERAPWYGSGLSAAGRVGDYGELGYGVVSPNNVASNWILGWWVDGKFLSLPLIALLLYAAATAAWRDHLAGLLLVAVLVNSFFSNLMFFPVTWVLLGLCLAAIRPPVSLQRRPGVHVLARGPAAHPVGHS